MKKKVQSSKEQGQAIVEMCICMIPILVIFVGMIFVASLGISNIRAFVTAKANAELSSRSDNAIGGYGDNIYRWDYGEDDDEDSLPFTADDKVVTFYSNGFQSGMETLVTQQLNDSLYSQENERGYDFMPTTELVNFNSDYDSMLAAADLVEGRADADETRNLNLSIGEILGISISTNDLRDMRANIVYYPALPTQVSP